MINLKVGFRILKGRCQNNQFLLVLSTELGSGDIRYMALAYGKSAWVQQAASGAVG